MYCQRCGSQLRNDAHFCGVCGATTNPPPPSQPPQPGPASGYPTPTPYSVQPVQPGYPQPAPYGQPPALAEYPVQPAYPQPVQYLQPLPTPSQPPPYAPAYPPTYYQPQPANPGSNQYPQPVAPAPAQQPVANSKSPGPWQQSAVGVPPGSVVAPIILGATYPPYGRRAAAFLIDISLILLFIGAAVVPMTGVLSGVNTDTLTVVLASIVSLASLVFLIWYPIVQPGRTSQTLGMRLLEIKVVDQKGKPPGIGKMAVRFLIGYPLCAIIMGVGFLVPLWDVQKQALDDKLVNTYVIIE